MTAVEAFKRGDEVSSKYLGGSIMTVLAVEGRKVRCTDTAKTLRRGSKSAVIAVNRCTTPDRQVSADRVDLFLRTNTNNCSLSVGPPFP